MARVKGIGIHTLRRLLRESGPDAEKVFLERLSPEDRKEFLHLSPLEWREIREDAGVLQAGADLFFPDDPQGLRKLGRMMAKEVFSGIYQIFLRVPSLDFVLQRVPFIWHSFFDTGSASVTKISPTRNHFLVRGYPDMPAWLREYQVGYLEAILEIVGIPDFRIVKDETNPQAWVWKINLGPDEASET